MNNNPPELDGNSLFENPRVPMAPTDVDTNSECINNHDMGEAITDTISSYT